MDFIFSFFHLSILFFFSSRRRHTRCGRDWSSDVCSSDLKAGASEVSAYITHGVLSEGASERIGGSMLKELVVTDSIEETEAQRLAGNIRRLAIAPLIGEAIARRSEERRVGKECRSWWWRK